MSGSTPADLAITFRSLARRTSEAIGDAEPVGRLRARRRAAASRRRRRGDGRLSSRRGGGGHRDRAATSRGLGRRHARGRCADRRWMPARCCAASPPPPRPRSSNDDIGALARRAPRARSLVAERGHLPGLRPQLRRRRRRRDGRPRRHPIATAVPPPARHRRRLADAVLSRPPRPMPATTWPTIATSIRASGPSPDLDGLISDAHALGIRVIVDIVPNHTSSAHPWFQAALASAPGSRRARSLPVPRWTWNRR